MISQEANWNTYFTTKILQLDLEGPSKRKILDANWHCFKGSIDNRISVLLKLKKGWIEAP